VGGPPFHYALIADGKVFVTVQVGTGSQLIALDQSTGATWGPIVLSGNSNAPTRGKFLSSAVRWHCGIDASMTAQARALGWSLSFFAGGSNAFPPDPPHSTGGLYRRRRQRRTLYALNEAAGALVWTQGLRTR